MIDNELKPWWQSRAVWGGVVAALGGAAGLLGYAIAPEEQETLATLLTALGSTLGGIIAVAGRIRATRRIGKPTNSGKSGGVTLSSGIIALIVAATLTACAATPEATRERWLAACETRASALHSLAVLRDAGKLSVDTSIRITNLVRATSGLCSGEQPPETADALRTLESNILQLIAIHGAQNVKPQQ